MAALTSSPHPQRVGEDRKGVKREGPPMLFQLEAGGTPHRAAQGEAGELARARWGRGCGGADTPCPLVECSKGTGLLSWETGVSGCQGSAMAPGQRETPQAEVAFRVPGPLGSPRKG